MYCIVQTDLVI